MDPNDGNDGTALAEQPPANGGSREELFELVAQLKQSVGEMNEGKIDEETVRRITAEAVAASRHGANPNGFTPEDVEETLPTRGKLARLQGQDRVNFVLQSYADRIAPLLRKTPQQVRAFQQRHDELLLLSAMTKKKPSELDFFHDDYVPARQQAMDTKTTGEGKELVAPPEISSELIVQLEGELQVLGLFPSITMPTNPFKFASKGPRQHVAILPEALEPGTPQAKKLVPSAPGEISLNATKFAGEIVTSKELEEDAAIAILPFAQSELLDWLSYDLEDACINGDTTGTMDAGVPVDSPKMGWDGLRKSVPVTAKHDMGGLPLDSAGALATRALMARYGLNPGDVVLIVSVPSLYSLIGDEKVQTVDLYGPGATLLTGELGRIWGVPIIASDLVPVTCDATGVVPATPGNLTIALMVHRQAFIHGVRRNTTVQVLTELYAESDQDAVLVTTRQAFTQRWPGVPAIAEAINVAT
jgi:HK97 family phage major capsid protein